VSKMHATMNQHLVESNIRDTHIMAAEAQAIAVTLLRELEENSTNANDDDDLIVTLHFDRSSIYQLVTLLSQLALAASGGKVS
jgi:hypothetical protein